MEKDVIKVKIHIDGKESLVKQGSSILEAALENHIQIPTLCHHPALSDWGGCRMCMVEVDGAPRLVASCVTPVRDGMTVVTSNDKIIQSRRIILEFLFAERNHNCMFCPRSGDCELQELAYELQMDHLTVPPSFQEFPVDMTTEFLGMDHNRCILCGRCVRACKEISGAQVINFKNRGPHNLIAFDLGQTRGDSTCYECGVCMQVCPTGAIYNRYSTHYAVKGHSKEWTAIESCCPRCGLLCPTVSYVANNNLIKIEGKLLYENKRPDKGQLCFKGRFEIFKSRNQRLFHPMVRNQKGNWEEETWENALDLIAKRLGEIRDREGEKAIFSMASSGCSSEQLLFFRDLMKGAWNADHMDTFDGPHFRTIRKAWNNLGISYPETSWRAIAEADFVLLVGANPMKTQPVIASLLRRCILEKGVRIAVLGQMDSLPPFIHDHIPIENRDACLLAKAMIPDLLTNAHRISRIDPVESLLRKSGEIYPGEILEKAGVHQDARKILHDVAEAFSNARNPLVMLGEEAIGAGNAGGVRDAFLLSLMNGLSPNGAARIIILKPYGNSAGAWNLGVASNNDPNAKDEWNGGLFLLNGEEIPKGFSFDKMNPEGFFAVLSPCFRETLANKVQVFIPLPLSMEEDGAYASLDGRETICCKQILSPPSEVKSSWETLWGLAQRAGFHPEFHSWEELQKKVKKEIA